MTQATNDASEQSAYTAFYVVSGILLAALVLYWYFQNEVVWLFFAWKNIELQVIGFFSPQYYKVLNWCNQVQESVVSLSDLKYLCLLIGEYLKWRLILCCGVMIVILFVFHPTLKHRKTFNMKTLSRYIAYMFRMSYKPNKLEKKLLVGKHSMGLSPIEYLQLHGLIGEKGIDSYQLYRHLSEQLGDVWCDINGLSFARKSIFSALIAYVADKRALGDKVLDAASCYYSATGCWQKRVLRRKLHQKIEQSLKQCLSADPVQKILSQHAYLSTLLCELLSQARVTGIVPCAQFLWFKLENRVLWYALQNVGRRAVFAEAAAITAHWKMESRLQTAIEKPMLEQVLKAFINAYEVNQVAQ